MNEIRGAMLQWAIENGQWTARELKILTDMTVAYLTDNPLSFAAEYQSNKEEVRAVLQRAQQCLNVLSMT